MKNVIAKYFLDAFQKSLHIVKYRQQPTIYTTRVYLSQYNLCVCVCVCHSFVVFCTFDRSLARVYLSFLCALSFSHSNNILILSICIVVQFCNFAEAQPLLE